MGDHGRSDSSPSWRLLEFCRNLFPFPISWLWEWHRIRSTDWLSFWGFAGSKRKKKQRKAAWGFVPAFFSVFLLPTTVFQRLTEWNRNTKGTCWTCQHFPAAFCDRKLRVVHTALNVCFVYFKVRITVNAYQGKIGSLLALMFSIESLMKVHDLSWYWLGWSCHFSIQKIQYLFEKRAAGAAREC